jgi:hypothetical protein
LRAKQFDLIIDRLQLAVRFRTAQLDRNVAEVLVGRTADVVVGFLVMSACLTAGDKFWFSPLSLGRTRIA